MALKSARAKGKNGELEACQTLRDLFGWVCRRAVQYSGWSRGGSSPDILVDDTPSLFWEIKRVERLNIPQAMGLAVKQAGRKTPVLMHRTNRSSHGWLLTIRLTDLPALCHAYESAQHASMASQKIPSSHTDDREGSGEAARDARVRPAGRGPSVDSDHAVNAQHDGGNSARGIRPRSSTRLPNARRG